MIRRLLALAILMVSASSLAPAQRVREVPETLLNGVAYRNLGPFRAGSWLSDVAVPEEAAIISTRSTSRRDTAACGKPSTTA